MPQIFQQPRVANDRVSLVLLRRNSAGQAFDLSRPMDTNLQRREIPATSVPAATKFIRTSRQKQTGCQFQIHSS